MSDFMFNQNATHSSNLTETPSAASASYGRSERTSNAATGNLQYNNIQVVGEGTASGPTATMTTTEVITAVPQHEVLQLTLRGRPNVSWDENVVDNEGMGRKSSKRCCIFHKQRAYDESSTDSSDSEHGHSDSEGEGEDNDPNRAPRKKIVRKKMSGQINGRNGFSDAQRYHA